MTLDTVLRTSDGRFHRGRAFAIALAMTAASFATSGHAKNVYRCGNTFQDQPCPEPKVAEVRVAERGSTSRDATPPCSASKEDRGCADKTARSPQPAGVGEAKR